MGFWGANGHDGVWHLTLINSLSHGSFQMPVFAGKTLQNYHIGFDLILAGIHKITNIPAHILYFQIIPPLIALAIGVLVYKFIYLWRRSSTQAFWATFFVYFGGGFGWMIAFFRDGGFGGESVFWSQQSISTLVNPPFALSLVFLVGALILLLKLQKQFTTWRFVFCVLLFSVLIQIKAYAAVLALGGLLVASVWQVWKERKIINLGVFISSLFISVILFFPFNKTASSLIVFQPFWFLETMMLYTDRLGWTKYFEAMTTYRMGGVWVKAVAAYVLAFAIFWVGNMGTRLFKGFLIVKWFREHKKVSFVEIFISFVIVAGAILPLFFLQKGTPWNTIQFFYYTLFFAGILAGMSLGEWLEKEGMKLKKIAVATIIVILTIPTTVGTLLIVYLPMRPPAALSNQEREALEFLKQQESGIVLTYPFDKHAAKVAEANPPRPLYLYESTAYVSAFSGKPVYLEDEVNLEITGYEWRARRDKTEGFFGNLGSQQAQSFLIDSKTRYIYLVGEQKDRLEDRGLKLVKIFNNNAVDIYRVY
ncbi:hypothetical protein CMO96_02480 [Candidatus Woesebacteria bacterium]|nr:hypothetical protein [Candidatus Woesebacteria bacterium]